MCSVLYDIFIGLITGAASSLVIAFFWHKHMKKVEERIHEEESKLAQDREYSKEIQDLCRYLDRVQNELKLPTTRQNSENLSRVLDSVPITGTFPEIMNENGTALMTKLYGIRKALEGAAEHGPLGEAKCMEYYYKFLQIEGDILKNQNAMKKKEPKLDQ